MPNKFYWWHRIQEMKCFFIQVKPYLGFWPIPPIEGRAPSMSNIILKRCCICTYHTHTHLEWLHMSLVLLCLLLQISWVWHTDIIKVFVPLSKRLEHQTWGWLLLGDSSLAAVLEWTSSIPGNSCKFVEEHRQVERLCRSCWFRTLIIANVHWAAQTHRCNHIVTVEESSISCFRYWL